MADRESPTKALPGCTLLQIAEKIFQGDAAGRSLEALLADAQGEWARSDERSARWIRVNMTARFWRSLLEHVLLRLVIPADRGVAWLMGAMILSYMIPGMTLELLFHQGDPEFSLSNSFTNGLVILCGPAAFVLNPINLARRCPSAPAYGWWYFAQFPVVWLAALWLWLYWTGGSGWRFADAIALATFGGFVSNRSHQGRKQTAPRER